VIVVIPLWAQAIGGALIGILFAGNAFFVARLVEQLDGTREQVWQLRQEVVVLSSRVENIPKCTFPK
jgi:hypothetical protein